MHFFGFVCYSGSLWVDFNISKKVFRQNFVILNNIQIKTLEVMFMYIYIYIYIYNSKVLSMILLVFKSIQLVGDFAVSSILKVTSFRTMKMLLQFLGMICRDKD